MSRKNSGFTLVEIMVVVGVVIIILTLALPGMLRSRMNANETAAVANCRLISNSCQSFYTNIMPHSYPSQLSDLISPASNPPYIDTILASGAKQGYDFRYRFIDSESFQLQADPTTPGRTGSRYFFVDETGVIRASSSGPAGPGDPALSG